MDEEENSFEDGFHMVDDIDLDDGEPLEGIGFEEDKEEDPDDRFH